jgi:3-oxoacyl-[acyl-carrier-protein] synthase II
VSITVQNAVILLVCQGLWVRKTYFFFFEQVCGASESSIDAISLGGFSRLKALSTSFNTSDRAHLASRPFDKDRDGFVMGEGAGILILEEYDRARLRHAKMYAEVKD